MRLCGLPWPIPTLLPADPTLDIGVNLIDPVFRGIYRGKQAHVDDLGRVLQRAVAAGIPKLICTGTTLAESKETIELVSEQRAAFPGLFATVGCHPTRCSEPEQHHAGADDYFVQLRRLIATDHARPESERVVVAVGECGLDYDRLQFCPRHVQLRHFPRHFAFARDFSLPLFLHCRGEGAHQDLLELLEAHKLDWSESGGVIHSFDGTTEQMHAFVALGLYIGINGCSLKTEANLGVAAQVPVDRLLLETDSPWCDIRPTHASYKHLATGGGQWHAPQAFKKEKFAPGCAVKSRNEPCYLRQVLQIMARERGLGETELADIVWNNSERLFFAGRK